MVFVILTMISASLAAQEMSPRELRFACGKTQCSAYLLEPSQAGKYPAVLFLHWLGSPNGDKREFLPEGEQLRKRGTVGLLVDMGWSDPAWFRARKVEGDFETSMIEIEKINAALDFLGSNEMVDKTRIAIVGHDFGGMFAMACLKERTKSPTAAFYVSVGSTPRLSDWFFYNTKLSAEQEGEYMKRVGPLDPIRVARELHVPALFQFAKEDEFISKASADQLFRAYAGPKELDLQDGPHDLNSDSAVKARVLWLKKKLQIE